MANNRDSGPMCYGNVNVISYVEVHLSRFKEHQTWTSIKVFDLKMVILVPKKGAKSKLCFFSISSKFLHTIVLKTIANKLVHMTIIYKCGVLWTGTCKSSEYWNSLALRVVKE